MKQEIVCLHITTWKQLNSSRFTFQVAVYHMKQKLIVNMGSFVDKVLCVPLPLFIVTLPPAHQLLVFFSPSQPTTTTPPPPTPPPLSILH